MAAGSGARTDLALADGRTAHVRFTSREDGDLRVEGDPAALAERRRAVAPVPWTWLHQVHGGRVLTVTEPGEHAGADADGAVTAVTGAALAVHAADCGPVALVADTGGVGVAHAGWRGLTQGVVATAVDALRALAPGAVSAHVGPLIGPECYEFGADDLDEVAAALGDEVRATTSTGHPALDLPVAVRAALTRAGVEDVTFHGGCTSCGSGSWSHRARGDVERQAVVVWMR